MELLVAALIVFIGYKLIQFVRKKGDKASLSPSFNSVKKDVESDALPESIEKKYSKLIAYFDNFDLHQPPMIVCNEINYYQMGWVGQTTMNSIGISEAGDKVCIDFDMAYNEAVLEKQGIDVATLPPFNKSKSWCYDKTMSQIVIANLVGIEIRTLCKI